MKIHKLLYYFSSGLKLAVEVKNPLSLIPIILAKDKQITLKNGLTFHVLSLLDCLIIKEALFDDVYKLELLKNPHCIIDIGAGLGEFALYAVTKFKNVRVLAFEPNTIFFSLLQKNISQNKLKNITEYNFAIGSKPYYTLSIPKEHAQSTFFEDKRTSWVEKIKIKAKRLDSYITSSVDLVKIDCEGAEWDIIKSISRKKLKKVKLFSIEYHRYSIPNIDSLMKEYLSNLKFACDLYEDPFDKQIGYLIAFNTDKSD